MIDDTTANPPLLVVRQDAVLEVLQLLDHARLPVTIEQCRAIHYLGRALRAARTA